MNTSFRRLAGLILAAGFALAACTTAATPTPAGAGAGGGGGGLTVGTGTSALGTILTGANGRTLYILTKDSPNASTCVDKCATNWPPLTVPPTGSAAGASGVNGTFATFTRADGTTQVTHNGQPLYYFAGDTKAGDTNGQGSGGVWFVATPTGGGAPAGGPGAGSPSAEPTKGGYHY